MRVLRVCSVAVLSALSFSSTAQNLIINEVSQGSSGAREYVELVVAGTPPGCSGVIPPTLDLRGMILDDNNGDFGSGTGMGIATGALRFSIDPFWSAIPQGTIIVVYNEGERQSTIPPDDASMSDGNARLILPANSPLIEGSSNAPSTAGSSYQPNGNWLAGNGSWNSVGLANGGDCFQVRQSISSGTAIHSVGFGNVGASAASVYFNASGAAKVYFCNDSPFTAGWSSGSSPANETPGAPNNASNAAFIQSFTTGGTTGLQVALTTQHVSCASSCDGSLTTQVTGGVAPFTYSWNVAVGNVPSITNRCPGNYDVTVTDVNGCTGNAQTSITQPSVLEVATVITNESCQAECDGSVSLVIAGGTTPYSVSWTNGETSLSLTNLCPDTYDVFVTDNNGCGGIGTADVGVGASVGSPDFITTGPFSSNDAPVQLVNQTAGGAYSTAECSGCLTASGVFSPAAAGPGTYTICYTLTNGTCTATDCRDFTVEGCMPQETEETTQICEGDSLLVFGNWESQADLYAHTYQDINGCDSTHRITLTFFQNPDQNIAFSFCEGDSVNVFGQWIDSAGIYTRELQSAQGCTYTQFLTVTESYCAQEAILYIPNVFTPNGDFTNEVFKVELIGGLVEEGFIFNRWGQIVARFDPDNTTWDGRNEQGEIVQDGVYTYLVRYSTMSGINEEAHGHVTLIR